MATLPNNVLDNHSQITLGFLRNGAASDVSRTARESSLPSRYHFSGIIHTATILGNATTRVPPCPFSTILETQIRNAFAQLIRAQVDEDRIAHASSAATGAFDEDAAVATAIANPAARLEAIGLGAVHAALVASFRIAAAEFRATERRGALLVVIPPAGLPDDAAYNAAMVTIDRGWVVRVARNVGTADLTLYEAAAVNFTTMTTDEAELAFTIAAIGQVSPVRAGAQLSTDGHHYHSDSESSSRHRAIEKEVLARASAAVKAVWRANTALLRNVVWWASVHGVGVGFLMSFGEDEDMPERLNATGFGSFSVGLPAQEDLFNRAGSYMAVLIQVAQTATAHGHVVKLDSLNATVTALRGLPRRGALPANRPALPGKPAAPWPAGCNTRAKALKLFLVPALDAAEPVAAWLFSYYREICSRSGIRSSSLEGSLLRSYSLKRAVANYLGEANRAQEMFSANVRFLRAEADKGKLEAYSGSA